MERVPGLLHDLTEAIQGLAERMPEKDPEYVWVFTAEQAYDYVVEDVVVKTFRTERSAQDFLYDFIHDGADGESIVEHANENGWDVEFDEPDHYRAFTPGSYAEDHVECSITKCKIED